MVPAMCYGYPDRTAEATGAGAIFGRPALTKISRTFRFRAQVLDQVPNKCQTSDQT